MKIEWAGRTDTGRVRHNNEDAFSVSSLGAAQAHRTCDAGTATVPAGETMLFIVADGLGGQNAGEVASALVVAGIPEELCRTTDLPASPLNRDHGDRLESAVHRMNERVVRGAMSDPRHRGMAATVTCLWIHAQHGFLAQVGDSRLYRYRAGRLEQLSHDQTEVGRLVRNGALSEAEAKVTVGRNVIDQALGLQGGELRPEIDWFELRPGDVFLLCSDGLVDRRHDEDVARCLRKVFAVGATLTAAADALIQAAEQSQSRDNITALLVRVTPDAASAVTEPVVAPARGPRTLAWLAAAAGFCAGAVAAWLWGQR